MDVGESQEDIESRCAALGQYAVVLKSFWINLRDQGMPDDLCHDLVTAWWAHALALPDDDE